ncbi:MAG: zinc-ribbon domain-containing protein [Bacilli bacterium]
MPFCPYCGSEVPTNSKFCPSCGNNLVETNDSENHNSNVQNESSFNNRFSNTFNENKTASSKKSDLKMVAFVLCILTCVVYAVTIVGVFGLIWCIPMTIKINKAYKENEPLSTGFKVCTLLFVNTIAGILLLVDND